MVTLVRDNGLHIAYIIKVVTGPMPLLHMYVCIMMSLVLARIRVSWTASGSLLKFPLYDFNDYDDELGGRF